jgi:hypothetical protein
MSEVDGLVVLAVKNEKRRIVLGNVDARACESRDLWIFPHRTAEQLEDAAFRVVGLGWLVV